MTRTCPENTRIWRPWCGSTVNFQYIFICDYLSWQLKFIWMLYNKIKTFAALYSKVIQY